MGKNHHVNYVSFSNSSTVDRGGGLTLNKLLNTRLKYESLDNVSVLEQATCNGKDMTVSEAIMGATKNVGKLFQVIEQGSGKMKHSACAHSKTNTRSAAQE